ncbi:SGNH/GDSL hydrolase family protein [Frigoriflavimonas asaccharolytica]|uniref:Lysophospholipase L1-like esterase n=1 Tax=Frigoriflavimonas asaccharolytica TaxID=2735899 RepID=A0A8J8K3U1_9FLAO|nr:SGNH/GDSL hydrolase family protein [Frigoriflavimonas asaccharolytica]NRS91005.1 lysophospholipase L1-like esterase [Frigoriflavimonas asaccharolytica]
MKNIFLTSFAAACLLATFSCKTEFETDLADIQVTKGNADFSKFVSVGNSLTSGYRDGTLYSDGQKESFPSMMAAQFALAGGGTFTQPMMPNNTGGFTNIPGFSGKLELKVIGGALSPVASAPAAALDIIGGAGKSFNNMGVPGAKSFHLLAPGYGNPANLALGTANPYFVRFASSPNASVVTDVVAQNPTFFSLWIGNNDVLGYATTGGDGTDALTPTATFSSVYNTIVNGLTANGAKGVLANIPNVTSIPFFTRVPAMPFSTLTAAQITQLNAAYAPYNGGLAQAKAANLITDAEYQSRLIKFTAGIANGAVINDKDLTNLGALMLPSYRQTTSKDLILLTTSPLLTAGGGTSTALADNRVLTEKEIVKVLASTTAFNNIIATTAAAKGLAYVDANSKLKEMATNSGINYNGTSFTATFVTGGAFSLDGVHLTGRGYALIANEFLKSINKQYGSTIPMVNVNIYSGVKFP